MIEGIFRSHVFGSRRLIAAQVTGSILALGTLLSGCGGGGTQTAGVQNADPKARMGAQERQSYQETMKRGGGPPRAYGARVPPGGPPGMRPASAGRPGGMPPR
jgi:hypothetical protein